MHDLTRDDFREWAHNPATEHFIKSLNDKRNSYLEELGGNYHKTPDAMQRVIGICQSLKASVDAIESYKIKDEEAQDAK